MKKFLKTTAVLLTLVMTISVFAGCTVSKDTSSDSTASKTSTATDSTAPAEDSKPMTITVKPQNDGAQDPNSSVTKAINEKFNVNIEYIYIDRTKESELLPIRIASGEIPDVMVLNDICLPMLHEQGALTNVPIEMVKRVMPIFYKQTTQNAGGDHVWDMYSEDKDNLYALPSLSAGSRYGMVPIWRDDWLANVGITKIPETMEEAEDAFYKFVKNDPDKNGEPDTYAMSQRGMWAVFGAYGGFPYFFFWKKADDGVVFNAIDPLMKDCVEKLAKYYKDGLIDPEFITGENKGQYYYFSPPFWNGKIGFTTGGMWNHVEPPLFEGHEGSFNYQQFKELQGENATYKEGKPLTGPGGMGIFKWTLLTGYGVGFGKQVANDPKKMEKVMSMLEAYNSTEEIFQLFYGGIKGETYYLDYGVIKFPEELQKNQTKQRSYAIGGNGMGLICNNFDLYYKYTLRAEQAEYANRVAKFCTTNWENQVIGALPSSGQYKAVIEKKVEEAYSLFITGKKNLSEWDSFVEDLKKSGLDQLTIEANEWYAKYFKK